MGQNILPCNMKRNKLVPSDFQRVKIERTFAKGGKKKKKKTKRNNLAHFTSTYT